MKIKRFEVGPLATNCYLAICTESKEAVVLDPGGDPEIVLDFLTDEGLELRYIINSHGHGDHIMGNGPLKKATGAQILIHGEDAPMLTSPEANLSLYTGNKITSPTADRFLQEGDTISWGHESLQVFHTPGHTPGGISLKGSVAVFTGDTLFAGSVGRTDFPGGSMSELVSGIKEKLLVLPPETRVLPGHGPESSIGKEKESNPFLQE